MASTRSGGRYLHVTSIRYSFNENPLHFELYGIFTVLSNIQKPFFGKICSTVDFFSYFVILVRRCPPAYIKNFNLLVLLVAMSETGTGRIAEIKPEREAFFVKAGRDQIGVSLCVRSQFSETGGKYDRYHTGTFFGECLRR